jgi:F420 biosynthesis protein FbiB-like protein
VSDRRATGLPPGGGPATEPTADRVPDFIAARRSIRAFRPDPVPRDLLDRLVASACRAPAPHHSRPWRFAVIDTPEAKTALARGMGERWRADLARDGTARDRIDELVDRSCAKITTAPASVLACLTWNGLDRYPDADRQRAEWGMALLSLGAAVENLMLAAAATSLASCWVAAPIFCPDEARIALELPPEWVPAALVLIGRPDPGYTVPDHGPVDLDSVRVFAAPGPTS